MWKKIGKALLYPPIPIMLLLIPVSTVLLIYSLIELSPESVIAVLTYVLAAYTLTVWCFKAPYLISFFKNFKKNNRFMIRWQEDPRFRVNISLFLSIFINSAFALFQFFLGLSHRSFWFHSLAGYYLCLALMRFFLFRHTKSHAPGEKMREELKKYRNCGWVFLLLNLTLSVLVLFMIRFDRTFVHHEITTITIAAYTFTSFTVAIVNAVKFRKYNSPAFSASKAISLAAALVSMITLETTMLTTFGTPDDDPLMRRVFLAVSGGVISVILLVMSVYIIWQSTKRLKDLKNKSKDDLNGR